MRVEPADVLRWSERVVADGDADREAVFVVTGRAGGVGSAPYDSLNLGDHVGDDPDVVRENRRRLAVVVGMSPERLVFMRQVHGSDVEVVEGPRPGEPPAVDAMVTREPGLVLAVLVADCTPVLLADPGAGVVAVAHAGRQGMAGGVVPAVLTAMRDLGARSIVARVGPSICARCYTVPLTMREAVAAVVPEARSVDAAGGASLDVAAGVVAQLAPHCDQLRWLPGCSLEDPDLFSYRRDGATGRFAGLAWLRR